LEKTTAFVIPSEARNLSWGVKRRRKEILVASLVGMKAAGQTRGMVACIWLGIRMLRMRAPGIRTLGIWRAKRDQTVHDSHHPVLSFCPRF